jgi:carbamoyltransferase
MRRIKHWAGFPSDAVRYCLDEAGIKVEDVDHIVVNRNPNANSTVCLEQTLFKQSQVYGRRTPPV